MFSNSSVVLIPPLLESAVPERWWEFRKLFEVFQRSGGKCAMISLFSPSVKYMHEAILGKDLSKHSDEELCLEMGKLYGPKSKGQFLDLLRSVRLHQRNLESLSTYITDFSAMMSRGEDAGLSLPEDMVLESFLSGLRWDQLASWIRCEVPKNLKEAVGCAFRCWIEVSGSAKPIAPVLTELPTCYGCQKRGHKKSECPNPELWPMSTVGKRSAAKTAFAASQVKLVKSNVDEDVLRYDARVEEVEVAVLLDTGSSVSLISPALAREAIESGCPVFSVSQELATASTPVKVDTAVEVIVEFVCLDGSPLAVPVKCGVAEMGEDILLGWPTVKEYDLLQLCGVGLPSLDRVGVPQVRRLGEDCVFDVLDLIEPDDYGDISKCCKLLKTARAPD